MKFGTSQPVRRREDSRFLTGRGRYTDDLAPREALHIAFVRSPVAHGRIAALDVGAARALPGVRGVFTAADLAADGMNNAIPAIFTVNNRDGSPSARPRRPVMAEGRVRHVGEIVAAVVAETAEAAADGAEAVLIEIDEITPHTALAPGGTPLHEEAPDNVAFDWALGDEEAVEATFAEAAHRIRLEVTDHRVSPAPLETRTAWARPLEGGERLEITLGSQGVWRIREDIADFFGWQADRIRVVTPDVGGGFGMKIFTFPEYYAVAHAAWKLGAPVRWQASRSEAFLSDTGGRGIVATVEGAFDAQGRLLAYRVDGTCDLGAYNSHFGQNIQTFLATRVMTGVYRVEKAFWRMRGIFTNTPPVDAYRGAGRPEANLDIERLMDEAARRLGIDPFEIRRRNVIPREAFPWRTPGGEIYDVGDFARVLETAAAEAFVEGYPARKAASAARGRVRGLGVAAYVEAVLGDPSEGARIRFCADGTVELHVGTQSTGQGHETAFAQLLSERLGLDIDRIRVVMGDSDLIPRGGGTGGSRSLTAEGAAIVTAADRLVTGLRPLAAEMLETTEEALRFEEGGFRLAEGNRFLPLVAAVEEARRRGQGDLVDVAARHKLAGRSFPNGVHVVEVELDPETGKIEIVRYAAADDFGTIVNPLLVEGQVHGGVAQGIGQVLMERMVFDDDGQPLTGSFMDYALPRADDLPFIDTFFVPVPSANNPLGTKGCGEAGVAGSLAAVTNAVADALAAFGVENPQMPFTPERVWRMIRKAEERRAAEG